MKKSIYTALISLPAALLLSVSPASGQTGSPLQGVSVEHQSLVREADQLQVNMDLVLTEMSVRNNSAALLVPCLVKGDRRKELPAVGVYGRMQWYQTQRAGLNPLSGSGEESYLYSRRPSTVSYKRSIPYEEWMNGSELVLSRRDYCFCKAPVAAYTSPLGSYSEYVEPVYPEYTPVYHYVRPVAEVVKTRSLSGRAFIDFPVNRTELQPDYRNNRAELAKITAMVDSVRNDSDITVTSLAIKGSASPEGPYANNERLARRRTESLKNYVNGLYHFADGFIVTEYVAEDWEGLREYVASSDLAHKAELLQIIDDPTLQPDTRDWRMKLNYADDYKRLLSEAFPSLRRSDYRIEYSVRSYGDVETIRRVMSESPQKLSLSEMYLLAQSMEPGSDEYNKVFETAALLYPQDETANLNAANAAMARKDLDSAARYLDKAGQSAEAVYARGVLAGLQGERDKAEALIRRAGEMGIADTDAAIEHLRNSRSSLAAN